MIVLMQGYVGQAIDNGLGHYYLDVHWTGWTGRTWEDRSVRNDDCRQAEYQYGLLLDAQIHNHQEQYQEAYRLLDEIARKYSIATQTLISACAWEWDQHHRTDKQNSTTLIGDIDYANTNSDGREAQKDR